MQEMKETTKEKAMVKMEKLLIDHEGEGEQQGPEIDLYGPVDFDDLTQVLERIFAVVEKYPTGGESAWFFFLNDWDRRFVLNVYDMKITSGRCPLSEKQINKARVILRKMLTPSQSAPRAA